MDKKTESTQTYSILMPPPNLTGEPHCGHMVQHLIMDALARYKRLNGFNVLFQPGVDHAGIQFEGTLNKILSKEDTTKEKLGREKWLERAWQFKDEIYKSFHLAWKMMGISADWDKEVFTLDPKVQKTVFEEFKTFWEEGLLYKGEYIISWCPKDQTAIEDVEMEYEERKETLYFVNYQIEGSLEHITIATTRPETIYADTGIAIYPNHPKFSQFVGKNAVNPLNGNKIPIFEDERVDKNFGTGALKITPGHDPLDYEIGKDHGLSILHAVDKAGRMTELAEDLTGLKIDEAEKKATEKLKESGSLLKTEELVHSVPVCERCKTTIEPLISEEWFVKMKPLAQQAIKRMGEITFYPSNYNAILSEWLEKIHDWSISRNLWWGHRIPVWYCEKCNPSHKVGKTEQMQVSFEKPAESCSKCNDSNWVQDGQILDTWFSSGMWPLATLGWPEKSDDFNTFFPWDFEISAPEIKYLWIARMVMLSLHFEDKIPFKTMFFNGTLRDAQGRKFSKSLGNGLYPEPFVKQWGADALRMALFSYAAPARDGKVSKQTLDERCKNFRNFETKIKNIYRFIYELKPENVPSTASKNSEDTQILKKLDETRKIIEKHFDNLDLHLAADEIYTFVWHEFADKYIEQSKKRRGEAQACLEHVFRICLLLLYPFMPFMSEELYGKIPNRKGILEELSSKA